ncbi:hypothetical protein Rhal01_01622 [Rubritalea halochordaticola]|uniref:DUF2442 domain-containing protein n=1 Tax=Rubritalea halochordaticola TaxID=714537 RepID=A0ABP9UYI8_9BACT
MIPRKGSKVMCLDDVQYRWIAYSTPKGTEVRIEAAEIPGSQMLIAQVPKLFNLKWIPDIIDYGLENGWEAGDEGEPLYIRKNRDTFRLLEDHEIPE